MKTQGLLVACALVAACRSSTEPDAGRRPRPPRVDVPPPPAVAPPEMHVDPSGGAAAALRAALGGLAANAPIPFALIVDVDGDRAMEVVARSETRGCVLAYREGGAWRARALGVALGDRGGAVRCLDPVAAGGRTFLVASSGGAAGDGGAAGPLALTLWGLADGAPADLWTDVIQQAQGDDGVRVSALGDRGLVVSHKERGVTRHQALAVSDAGRLSTETCWSATEPRALPTPPVGCTARPAPRVVVFAYEDAPLGANTDLGDTGSLAVVAPGAATRDGARAYCVKAPDGSLGYAFLTAQQLRGCPEFPPPPR